MLASHSKSVANRPPMSTTIETVEHLERLKQAWMKPLMQLIEEATEESSPSGTSLLEMVQYHLSTGGKRLRALLPIAIAEALDVDPNRILGFAAGCEMLHNATLVHDDLQDGDRVRRGEPTVWVKWDEARAINLGDAMLYWTLDLAARVDFDDAAKGRLIGRIVRDTLRVIDGQEREFLLKEMERPTVVDYFRMVEGKTSGLFALPIAGTAELCGADPALVGALAGAAVHLGVLFQIQDDVLDLYADKGREARGSDIGEGKISALVVHFLANAPDDEATWLESVLRADREDVSSADVERAARLFRERGSLQWVKAEIDRRRALALDDPTIARHPRIAQLLRGIAELFLAPIAEVEM